MCQANKIITSAMHGEDAIGHAERNRKHRQQLREAKEEFDALMKEGGCESSESAATSPTTSSTEGEAGSGTMSPKGGNDERV